MWHAKNYNLPQNVNDSAAFTADGVIFSDFRVTGIRVGMCPIFSFSSLPFPFPLSVLVSYATLWRVNISQVIKTSISNLTCKRCV